MARSAETTRFVRAAIKAGLRMQQGAPNDGVRRLQQIKTSVRKTEKRRENRL